MENHLKTQIDQVANLSIGNNNTNTNNNSCTSPDDGEKSRSGKFIACTYCSITFRNRSDLRQHCQTETHQNVIMSDEGMKYDRRWSKACSDIENGFHSFDFLFAFRRSRLEVETTATRLHRRFVHIVRKLC